jgi:hypothetical protein
MLSENTKFRKISRFHKSGYMRIRFSPGRGGGGQIQPIAIADFFVIPDIVHGKDDPHRPRK